MRRFLRFTLYASLSLVAGCAQRRPVEVSETCRVSSPAGGLKCEGAGPGVVVPWDKAGGYLCLPAQDVKSLLESSERCR